jgi:hypothetical protein
MTTPVWILVAIIALLVIGVALKVVKFVIKLAIVAAIVLVLWWVFAPGTAPVTF